MYLVFFEFFSIVKSESQSLKDFWQLLKDLTTDFSFTTAVIFDSWQQFSESGEHCFRIIIDLH